MTAAMTAAPSIAAHSAAAHALRQLGAEHARRCYQCGTCSVVCPLTPASFPFPRKEMLWAQWGLQDRLLSDMDAWLCYQCNDCITHCPTDARPGDVMAAIRALQITHYATPRFLALPSLKPLYAPLALLLPALIVFLLISSAVLIPNNGRFSFPQGRILFADFIPELHIDIATFATLGLVFALAGIGLYRFWRGMQRSEMAAGRTPAPVGPAFRSALIDVFSHRAFRQCGTNRTRFWAHLGIFYGFLMLVAATTGAFVYTVILPELGISWSDGDLSLPLWDPVKLIGNIGGILLFAGATWATYERIAHRAEAGATTYFDWFFVAVIFLATITGFLLQLLRYTASPPVAYSFYLVHLLFVYTFFTYFPFSKLAHLMYRTAALTYANQIDRKAPDRDTLPRATLPSTPPAIPAPSSPLT